MPAVDSVAKAASLGLTARWIIGTPKPRVLPVPVLAWPMMSWPSRATGRVMAWMGKGWTMPAAESASTMSGWTSKSANVRAGASGAASAAVSMAGSSARAGVLVMGLSMSLDRAGGHARA